MAYETTTELAQAVEFEMGEVTDGTSQFRTRIIQELDRAHKTLIAGGGELNADANGKPIRRPVLFSWARSATPIVVNLETPYETGTVSVTNNSTTATFSASVTADKAGWYLKIDDEPEVYRISAHGGSSDTMTLDAAYVGTTDTAAGYKLFKLDYTVGSDDVMFFTQEIHSFKDDTRIEIIPLESLYKRYPLKDISEAMPSKAAIIKQTGGTLTVRFNSYSEETERLNFYYVPEPSDLNTSGSDPIIPRHHRKVLVHLVSYYMMRGKDDDRAKSHFGTAKQLFDALVTENYQMNFGNDDRFALLDPDGVDDTRDIFKVVI